MRDALGAVQTVLVLGGASEIGLAIAGELAGDRRPTVVLAGRDQAAMRAAAESAGLTGRAQVHLIGFDALQPGSHDSVLAEAAAVAGADLDVVVIAFALLGEQADDEAGGDGAVRVASTNYVGALSAGLASARALRRQGHGAIVALSSVAGERVRRANFIYGSSKAGMDGFFQGLADSLVGTGVRVLIVRPGFVHTKMTAGMKAQPLSTDAATVATATVRALQQGKPVVWVPPVLRWVFVAFRHLPRGVWRRMPS